LGKETYSWDLDGFDHLQAVRYDWLKSWKSPILQNRFPFSAGASKVTKLDIRGIEWLNPMVLQHIVEAFSGIKVLSLRQEQIWCSLCNTCTVPAFLEPVPEKIVYQGGLGLPVGIGNDVFVFNLNQRASSSQIHYARALAFLPHLESVHIASGCHGTGQTHLGNHPKENPDLWAGECDDCLRFSFGDEEFKDSWIAKKTRTDPGTRPPSLQLVEWRFFSVPVDEDWNSEQMDENEFEEEFDEDEELEST
jgi:hypothetical protein